MNFEFFTARRIIASKDHKSSVSAPIIKIAITAIAMGVVIMLVSIAVTLGLQQKIREKVSAFNGDIIISKFDTNNTDESGTPISTQQTFYPEFSSVAGIAHIQVTASKGGVIRTESDFEGVVVKGVGDDYNWQYFEDYLVEVKQQPRPRKGVVSATVSASLDRPTGKQSWPAPLQPGLLDGVLICCENMHQLTQATGRPGIPNDPRTIQTQFQTNQQQSTVNPK